MDMTGLEYFVSCAQHLNFTKAAEACFITQTAMSQHIAKIEKELGFKLFFREHRAVRLTPGGLVFYNEALKMLRQYKESVQRSASAAAGFEGALRLGFTNYIERAFLPDLIGRFHADYPRIEILLNKNDQSKTAEELRAGFNDVSVVFPYDVADDEDVCVQTIDTYKICAVVNTSHALSKRDSIRIGELEKEPVIIHRASRSPGLHKRVNSDWAQHNFHPEKVIEANSADAMLFLVEAGFGNALMPSYVKQLQNDRLAVIDLEGASVSIAMAVAYMRNTNNPSVKLFLKALSTYTH
jgi:DNA-binding transcriptional LysR family regulator